jgi:hypothetical protein
MSEEHIKRYRMSLGTFVVETDSELDALEQFWEWVRNVAGDNDVTIKEETIYE